MSEQQPLLGICHVYASNGEDGVNGTRLAAVYCSDHDSFDASVRDALQAQGQRLLWSEDVLPASEWITRNPTEKSAAALARKVHDAHPVELAAFGAEAADVADNEPYLIIEEIEGVEPLDAQFGVENRKAVPDLLHEVLFSERDPLKIEVEKFGGVEAVPRMKTYIIIDSAKVMHLPMLLGHSGLAFKCLFKGKAEKEQRHLAPFIVELVLENSFTRNLFTSAGMPSNMWDAEPGIYVRSRASIEDLWAHFRKFTQLYSEVEQAWRYFRFYAPEVARTIVAAFDEEQFRQFGRHCAVIACQSKSGFCVITPPPEPSVTLRREFAYD